MNSNERGGPSKQNHKQNSKINALYADCSALPMLNTTKITWVLLIQLKSTNAGKDDGEIPKNQNKRLHEKLSRKQTSMLTNDGWSGQTLGPAGPPLHKGVSVVMQSEQRFLFPFIA